MPALLARLLLAAHVDLAGRVVAHQHRGQAGRYARLAAELGQFLGDLGANLLRECFSVEDRGSHGSRSQGAMQKKRLDVNGRPAQTCAIAARTARGSQRDSVT